jgi:hypothetical protein
MSEKVKITKEQAEAIDMVLNNPFHSRWDVVIGIHAKDSCAWSEGAKALNGMPLDTLIRALYIGYEVELTPEEKAVEWMIHKSRFHFTRGGATTIFRGISKILNGEEPNA